MKKILHFLSIIILCFFVMISIKKPLASFNTNQEVNVRYEFCEDGYKPRTYNLTISSSDNKILYNTLQKKAWYISSGLSDFFFSQNYVSPVNANIYLSHISGKWQRIFEPLQIMPYNRENAIGGGMKGGNFCGCI